MRIEMNKILDSCSNIPFDPEKKFGFNPFEEKLTIGHTILEIGKRRKIRLSFDLHGAYRVSFGKRRYIFCDCCEHEEEANTNHHWIFHASIIVPKSAQGDWAKYAAEDLLYEILQQMEKYGSSSKKTPKS